MAIVRATKPFTYWNNGVPRTVRAGDLFDTSDPCVKGRAGLFEPVEVAAARTASIEDATAEPGARRSVSTTRGRRKPASEPERDEPSAEGDA
ncbi:hypothetical protein [Mycobacterium xenopi]|uniref:Uncharacterized protein n=1 Tax=Mycobacterium xenopi TaxID=1789 RepID=A0AAD1GZK1_MYCXE|nr:hypothetical protein [Mycobacterium xenopi]EUA18469.1 hypothetical protein I552_9696 [Mycobacterium xenopi 3993]ORX21607.1 hypothetical protein AWC32_21590 [Mycobacterium xenopi]BBU22156.1 hypothetical protein MYXE_19460 [Mycobacterium xenopi]SPX78019.1 Uncharacterised protein [Mycobacterium xenopi]